MNDNVIQEFIDSIKEPQLDNNTTYSAVVSKVDDEGIIWVHLTGSDIETPTSSSSSEVKKGDIVTVQWRNNKLYIVGNSSNPSAGVIRVDKVEAAANTAKEAADNAVQDANRARIAAEDAEVTAKGIESIARRAETDAGIAKGAADNAMKGLAQVEDVVGTLNWLTEHSKITEDTTPQAGKSYYIKNQDNTFTLVTDVEGKNPAQEGWYEMDEAIQNYIMTHLALTDDGLYVLSGKPDSWKLLVSSGSMIIYDEHDNPVAQYSSNIILGNRELPHIEIDSSSVELYGISGSLLGYIGLGKVSFPIIEITQTQYITDKYAWRKTPSGSLGLYRR